MMPDHVLVSWTHPKEIDYVSAGYWDYFYIIEIGHERNALHEVAEILVTINTTHRIPYLVYFHVTGAH